MPERPIKSIAGLLSVVEFERRYFPRAFEDKQEELKEPPAKLEMESPKEKNKEVRICK